MNKQYLEIYKKLLFSKELKTYAIVDGLRDEEIADKIFLTDLNHTILWDDEIIDDATETPLYLVELEQEDELVEELLNKHEKSIATYFQSPYGLEALQRYYSTFTYPKIELEEADFKKGIFGFYDPNILPNYLETLYNEEKTDEFFVGIALWLTPRVEDESLAHFEFRTKRGNFKSVSLVLENFLEEENIALNFDNISLPSVENLDNYVQNRVIDHRQIELFEKVEIETFVEAVFVEFEENKEAFMYDEMVLKALSMNKFYPRAKELGFEIYYFILLCCLNQEEFMLVMRSFKR